MSLCLTTPESFPAFPYSDPYAIQVNLMRHIYSSIEQKKVSIVESPTGTGKTLSLLCASLTWLADEQARSAKSKLATTMFESNPDWVTMQTLERRKRELENEERQFEERLARIRKNEALIRKAANARVRKKRKTLNESDGLDADDDSFLLENEEATGGEDNISPAVRALMKRLEHGTASNLEPEITCTKIYYASRTHSQLSQVLSELRKLKHCQSTSDATVATSALSSRLSSNDLLVDNKKGTIVCDNQVVDSITRTVSLGSRKHLCINGELKARSGDLDEACRALLSEKGTQRCQYLPPAEDQSRVIELKDHILASPKDLEDLVVTGQMLNTCPYFGSRGAIPRAELVALPYNLLLHKTAREALGIDLTNQVVIIDEAHNLISTLLSLSTISLHSRMLIASLDQLLVYFSKFRTRLTTHHGLHIKRVLSLLEALKSFALERTTSVNGVNERMTVMTVGEFTRALGRKAESVNLSEIEAYLRSSKIARKINGYSDKVSRKAGTQDSFGPQSARLGAAPPLHTVESFLLALTTASEDGRIIVSASGPDEYEFRYQHLNPSIHFREVVDSARCVILAGGTMSPISDFENQLFSHMSPDRLSSFSCGHVIPRSNLQTIVLTKGPVGGDLQFKYERRGNKAATSELGQILLNLASIVSGGMIVFFPSYNFLDEIKTAWTESKVIEKLNAKKKIFYEPRDNSDAEVVLQEYTRQVYNGVPSPTGKKAGALLFAVIGAKLSEGLNFSDDLARAVVVIGLPFANMNSPDLRERLKYVNALQTKVGVKNKSGTAKDAGMELYENMCMNSVNQSIGRAIRHKGDWASLVLVDSRYGSSRIRRKLPQWISETVVVSQTFGQAMKELGKFFRDKRDARI